MLKYICIFSILFVTISFFAFQKKVDFSSKEKFTKFHLDLVDNLISHIEHIKEFSDLDSTVVFEVLENDKNSGVFLNSINCEKLKQDSIFSELKKVMNSYDYIGSFDVSMNLPQFCQENFVNNFELDKYANNNNNRTNIIHKSFNFFTQNGLSLSVLVSKFDNSNPNSNLFWGYIYINSNQFSDEIINPSIQQNYDVNIKVLIPKNLGYWITNIKPKYLSILTAGTTSKEQR